MIIPPAPSAPPPPPPWVLLWLNETQQHFVRRELALQDCWVFVGLGFFFPASLPSSFYNPFSLLVFPTR